MKKIFTYSKNVYLADQEVVKPQGPEVTPPAQALPARAEASQQYVAEREKQAALFGKTKEALYQQWLKNNEKGEIKKLDEDPKYLAKKEVTPTTAADEAFVLLGLIERFMGGKEKAMEVYAKCWSGNKFNREALLANFGRNETNKKLGFYWGTKTVCWKPDFMGNYDAIKKIKGSGISYKLVNKFYARKVARITLKGWWAHDNDETWTPKNDWESPDFEGGKDFKSAVINKLSAGNESGGYGDEWLGGSLKDLQENIGKELYPEGANVKAGQRDSELSPAREGAVLKALKGEGEKSEGSLIAESLDAYPEKMKKTLYTWFTTQKDKWISLPADKLGAMSVVFGKGCGNYLYRYSPENKKIFIVRIDGVSVPPGEFGGYIAVKEAEKELGERTMQDDKTFETTMKEVINKMDSGKITNELIDTGKKVEGISDLDRTNNMLQTLPAFRTGISCSALEQNFFGAIIADLNNKLQQQGIKGPEKQAERDKYINLRMNEVRLQFNNLVSKNAAIAQAVNTKKDAKIKIEISDNQVKEVTFANEADQKAADDAKKAEDEKKKEGNVEKQINGTLKKIETFIQKKFNLGPQATSIVMMILNTAFKLKEGLVDLAKGAGNTTAAIFASCATAFLGIKGINSIEGFTCTKMSQAKFDKIFDKVPADKQSIKNKTRWVFDSGPVVTKFRIKIQNKGLIGFGFPVYVDGQRIDLAKPADPKDVKSAAEKGKKAVEGVLAPAKRLAQLKDKVVIIEPGTTLTQGTQLFSDTEFFREETKK